MFKTFRQKENLFKKNQAATIRIKWKKGKFVADPITIDDRKLLEKAASNLQRREQNLAELPRPLASSQIPTTDVVKPSSLVPDPLRITKLYSNSTALFKALKKFASNIFNRNIAPAIGDKDGIEELVKIIKNAKPRSAQEKKEQKILLEGFAALEKKEIDKEEIDNRLKEFVLG